MTYKYHCDKCNKDQEVIKPKNKSNEKEKCFCGWQLTKIITVPSCKLFWWID